MGIIDKEKIQQYASIHAEKEYGVTSYAMAKYIVPCIIELDAKSVLDYGCGQSKLYKRLSVNGAKAFRYDPSIPEINTVPTDHVDLVINTDVLEHIPEPDVDDVIAHIRKIGNNCFFNIHTGPAKEILPSGENAHCTIHTPEWWNNKIKKYYPDSRISLINDEGCIIKTWPKSNNHIIKRTLYKEREKWSKRFKQYMNSINKRIKR